MLASKRLYFRPFNYDDYDALFEMLSNPKVCQYLPGKKAKTEEEVTKWLHHFIRSVNDEHNSKLYAIIEIETDLLIGYGGIGYVREFDCTGNYVWINPYCVGKGYGTETSLFMKEYAKELGLKNLIALADVDNQASQKILRKTGFKQIKEMELWGLDVFYYEMKL